MVIISTSTGGPLRIALGGAELGEVAEPVALGALGAVVAGVAVVALLDDFFELLLQPSEDADHGNG
jgi:hypothetical protein